MDWKWMIALRSLEHQTERQAQIFGRFYREPEVHKQPGIGIGIVVLVLLVICVGAPLILLNLMCKQGSVVERIRQSDE